MSLDYTKRYFNPAHVFRPEAASTSEAGDTRRAPVYVYTDEIVLAVNVAIATGRPLLVRGPSGSGKSSLARSVAECLKWRYYEAVITSRTQAQDLLWEVDLVRRLNDARPDGGGVSTDYAPYVVPGVLWWAFDRESAARRGTRDGRVEPAVDPHTGRDHDRAVVLLDEIDKADPDVPNNLLVPLGSLEFVVTETASQVKTSAELAPLVVLTTNEERELSAAFLRRCVEIKLGLPGRERMLEIAGAHFPEVEKSVLKKVAESLLGPDDAQVDLSPAEFLDTVRASIALTIDVDDPAWAALARTTAWKHGRTPPS